MGDYDGEFGYILYLHVSGDNDGKLEVVWDDGGSDAVESKNIRRIG